MSDSAENESIGRQIYKHLMEGVSHMLPFVVAGGIFIALAFLIDTILGAPQDGNFGSNTPVAAWFKGIGGVSFGFMLAILAGYIGRSIADRPGLLVGFVGGRSPILPAKLFPLASWALCSPASQVATSCCGSRRCANTSRKHLTA